MQERLLQYIWQHQYIQSSGLTTVQGQVLEVVEPGTWNHEQGPDFLHARVRMDGTLWVGQVEIHIRASDWFKHRHEGDAFYQNIILHVVWEQDLEAYPGGLPTLQLKDWVPGRLLDLYTRWMEQPKGIACAGNLPGVLEQAWLAWKQTLAAERMQQKGVAILQLVRENGGDWEAVFWRLNFRYLGGKVNGAAFEQVFVQLGWRIIRKYLHRLESLEALLLGTAGMLDDQALGADFANLAHDQKRYLQLARKHELRGSELRMKQMRMRPASFPFVRMRQLARLLHGVPNLFENIGKDLSIKEWQELIRLGTTENGQDKLTLAVHSDAESMPLGRNLIDTLIINVILPITTVYPYAPLQRKNIAYGVEQLRGLPAEPHHITRLWRAWQVEVAQARDSQALLQLYESYCQQKNCLACRVGQICLSDPTNTNRH